LLLLVQEVQLLIQFLLLVVALLFLQAHHAKHPL
jgi:hypothetical protein